MAVNIHTNVVPFGQLKMIIGQDMSPVKEHQEVLDRVPVNYYVPQETAFPVSDFPYDMEFMNSNFLAVPHMSFELLFGKIAPNWKVIKPLLVKIEQEKDGSYLVSEDLFTVYGIGDTSYNALQDYITSLIEYYNLLSARAEKDTPNQTLFRCLQQYLHKTHD
jgi:hypothetical protein